MIELGKIQDLYMTRATDNGVYLTDKEETEEVLLPRKFVPTELKIGDEIEVFIFTDSEDRLTATIQTPRIELFSFAPLICNDVNTFGAFMDWGLEKDLFVPFSEQSQKMEKGHTYLVYLYHDTKSDRLVASSRLQQFVEKEDIDLEEGQPVDLLVWEETDLGMKVIIEKQYGGLIYKNDYFKNLARGEALKGYIDKLREDGKIDVRLRKRGYLKLVEPNAKKIMALVEAGNGFLALTDKSAPDKIYDLLGMSKKNFKKAIGGLYRSRMIRLEKDGIYLNDK